jgi:hypothetical protein
MNRRSDYKVSMMESMELEPLGGEKSSDTPNLSSKRNGINKYSEYMHLSLSPYLYLDGVNNETKSGGK